MGWSTCAETVTVPVNRVNHGLGGGLLAVVPLLVVLLDVVPPLVVLLLVVLPLDELLLSSPLWDDVLLLDVPLEDDDVVAPDDELLLLLDDVVPPHGDWHVLVIVCGVAPSTTSSSPRQMVVGYGAVFSVACRKQVW